MADTPSSQRYSEQEMALILKRAAELQEGADGQAADISLRQIQDIAAEAGISPSYVAEAAAELLEPMPRVGWLGAPTRFHDDRWIERPLNASAIGQVIESVRVTVGLHGEVQQVLDSVEWRGQSPLGMTILTLSPRDGGTRIAVTISRADHATVVTLGSIGIGLLGALGGVVLALNFADSAIIASGIIAGSAVVAMLGSARLMWANVARRWRRTASTLVETVAERARQLVADGDPVG